MPIIALVGNKGGAGKTTLSVNLAAGLANLGSAVIVDADPQGSSLQWNVFAEHPMTENVIEANDNLSEQVAVLSLEHDYVVVDCPPSVHAIQTTEILSVCDLALIPVQPSPVDLWATVHIEDAVNVARESNEKLQVLLVINQLETRTTLSKLVRDALEQIELPVAKTALRRRAVFRSSALEGKNVFQMGHRGKEAAREMNELIQEIVSI